MSPDRFDVLERFAPLFEAPEPSIEGFLRRRDRTRRNERIAAGVIGIALFVAAVVLFAGLISAGRPQTPAGSGPTETTAPPHPTGVGLVGLPPEGAPPSTPERGERVLFFAFLPTGGDPGRFSLHVYADGRVIWERLGDSPDESRTGLIEQRLTPEGVELVLAEVISTGLFDHDRVLVRGLGSAGGIEVRAGDRLVHFKWGDATWGFEEGDDPDATISTPGQVRALERLDARLEDLASWLPASAWEDPELRAYVPSRYMVCYSGQGQPLGRPRILDLLPASAEDLLRAKETNADRFDGPLGSTPYWCSVLTTDEAREVVEILEDAGASKYPEWLMYAYSPSGRSHDEVNIDIEPVLPDFRVNEWLAAG